MQKPAQEPAEVSMSEAPPSSPTVLHRLEGYSVLYGGSFDPPHMGHQMALLQLLEGYGADDVIVMPVGTHAFGKPLSPFAHRFAMAARLIAPFGARARVSCLEQELPPPSTTWQTVQALAAAMPRRRVALAVGADLFAELGHWHQAERLFAAVPVALLGRQGAVPSPRLPAGLLNLPAVQSRQIRAQVAAGHSLAGLVPRAIANYIDEHALYRAAAGR